MDNNYTVFKRGFLSLRKAGKKKKKKYIILDSEGIKIYKSKQKNEIVRDKKEKEFIKIEDIQRVDSIPILGQYRREYVFFISYD